MKILFWPLTLDTHSVLVGGNGEGGDGDGDGHCVHWSRGWAGHCSSSVGAQVDRSRVNTGLERTDHAPTILAPLERGATAGDDGGVLTRSDQLSPSVLRVLVRRSGHVHVIRQHGSLAGDHQRLVTHLHHSLLLLLLLLLLLCHTLVLLLSLRLETGDVERNLNFVVVKLFLVIIILWSSWSWSPGTRVRLTPAINQSQIIFTAVRLKYFLTSDVSPSRVSQCLDTCLCARCILATCIGILSALSQSEKKSILFNFIQLNCLQRN